MKIIKNVTNYLVSLAGFISFFIPTLPMQYKIVISFGFLLLYFIGMSVYFHRKLIRVNEELKKISGQISEHKEEINRLDDALRKNNEFIHKRTIFIKHKLLPIKELMDEHYTHSRDKYRGKNFEEIHSETKLIKNEIGKIIQDEARDFDDQLFYIQGNQDNR